MSLAEAKKYTEEDYYNLPEDIRAELIDGFLIYNQAAPSSLHQSILSELHLVIGQYIKSKKGACRIFPAPFAVKLREEWNTIVEPDLSIICDKDKITDKGCTGAPDWIIEIVSPSNSRHDYATKLNLYTDAGVREYWIVDPKTEQILVYCLDDENFTLHMYTFQDKVKVNIYEDFYIDFAALDF